LRAEVTTTLFGESFKVLAVLPRSGTVDDGRIFAHLHTVQRLAGTGEVINAIEIVGCCEAAASDLIPQLQKLIPTAKVVTISQLVQTQVGVNRLISKTSWFVLAVLATIGCATVGGAIAANVRERRREIGTLMALGATPSFVARLFLLKALWLGIGCGSLGCILGIALAMWFGPMWAGVSIQPLLGLSTLAIAVASALALLAAYLPARRGARLDPCACFQEV
jgi:putative ABC transport system permease protein